MSCAANDLNAVRMMIGPSIFYSGYRRLCSSSGGRLEGRHFDGLLSRDASHVFMPGRASITVADRLPMIQNMAKILGF